MSVVIFMLGVCAIDVAPDNKTNEATAPSVNASLQFMMAYSGDDGNRDLGTRLKVDYRDTIIAGNGAV
jgi:hypothetical protein